MLNYKISKTVKESFDAIDSRIRETLSQNGFGIITEIDLKATIKEKLDKEHRRHKILGACNPNIAYDSLNRDINVSLIMPCNVCVIDNEDGTTTVSAVETEQLLAIIDNERFIDIAREVDDLLKNAINSI